MTALELIKAARDEIGVRELPAGSNNVKYNTAYYGGTVNNASLHWCVVFIWWLFHYKFNEGKMFCGGDKTASCGYVMNWAKLHGKWVTKDYKAGDLFLFDWNGDGAPEHIGIFTGEMSGNLFCTVEGNTSDAVAPKTRALASILGAYRPDYTQAVSYTSPDLEPPEWALDAAKWAIENGIIKGYGNGDYGWLDKMSRAEFVTMLKRYHDKFCT